MANTFRGRRRSSVRTSYQPTTDRTPDPPADGGATGARRVSGRASAAARFDAFYAASWQPLLLQAYAVSGDLHVATDATRRAFVDAWHHWSRAEWRGPGEYVRSQAFARGTWRTRTQVFRRAEPVEPEQQETLTALAGLSAAARKAVVLACLSQIELHDISRQIAETDERTVTLVDEGLEGLGAALGLPPDDVPVRLHALEPAARAAARPTASEIRALGVRRRRGWLVGGSAAAVALTLGAGALVQAAPKEVVAPVPASLGSAVTQRMLLPTSGLAPLGRPARWSVLSTGNNTEGTGLKTFCQASRFADPQGLRAFVRTYRLGGDLQRRAVQTIELSRSRRQSDKAYHTVLGWFGGCSTSRLQLLSSYDVQGLGDEAEVIKMRAQSPRAGDAGDGSKGGGTGLNSYAVGVVRTGSIVTWTAFTTDGASNPSTDNLVSGLSHALQRVCTSRAAGSCAARPAVQENPPPPSGEQAGMLALADLPPVPGVSAQWVGTDAATSRTNPSATTCDNADFVASGADPAYVRTFLIPKAKLPTRFGLSETLGEFPGRPKAQGLIDQVTKQMASCEDRDLGASITEEASRPNGTGDSTWHLWRLESEVSSKQTIDYWMGVARVGSNVAQVSFVPGDGKQDLSKAEFTALVVRARDRLFELGAKAATTARPSASPSASGSVSPSAGAGNG